MQWKPKKGKYVVIGNPPFGLRGHLALQFINHSEKFADIVAFILPQSFASDGKGAPYKRVKGYKIAHTESLPDDSFQYPNGKLVKVSTVFQVWTKINTEKISIKPKDTCRNFIKIYSLSDGGTPSSTRNKKMLHSCDVYLPSTCFSGMKSYSRFNDLPNKRGYGIIIKQEKLKNKIKKILMNHNWKKTAYPSTNAALNLRSSIISDVVVSAGYRDDKTGN